MTNPSPLGGLFPGSPNQQNTPYIKKGQMASSKPDNSSLPVPNSMNNPMAGGGTGNNIFNQSSTQASNNVFSQQNSQNQNSSNQAPMFGFTNSKNVPNNVFANKPFSPSPSQTTNQPSSIFSQTKQNQPSIFAPQNNSNNIFGIQTQSQQQNQSQAPSWFNLQANQNNQVPNTNTNNIFATGQNQNQNNIFGQQNSLQNQNLFGNIGGNQTENLVQNYLSSLRQPNNTNNFSRQNSNQPFNPRGNDQDNRKYLNNLLNNDSVRNFATSKELLEFADGWSKQMTLSQRFKQSSDSRREQITKLFDAKKFLIPSQIRMRELQPVELTLEVIEDMNDELSCRHILSSLWDDCKTKLDQSIRSLTILEKKIPSKDKNRKIKECDFSKQLVFCWKEIKALTERMKKLEELQKATELQGNKFDSQILKICQNLKKIFAENNKQKRILQQAQEEVTSLSQFFDSKVLPMFNAFTSNKAFSYEDPDGYILDITAKLLANLKQLDYSIEQMISMRTYQTHEVNVSQVVEDLCQYYQNLAEKLYEVHEKVKKCTTSTARQYSSTNYEQTLTKIEEKVKENLEKKMEVYNKIKEIEQIISKRSGSTASKLEISTVSAFSQNRNTMSDKELSQCE